MDTAAAAHRRLLTQGLVEHQRKVSRHQAAHSTVPSRHKASRHRQLAFDGRVERAHPATGATRCRVAVGAPDDTEGAKVAGNLVYAGGSGTIYVLRLQTGGVATHLGTGSFAVRPRGPDNSDVVLSGGWVFGAPAGYLTPPTLTAWRVS